jgi:hypothetical protein
LLILPKDLSSHNVDVLLQFATQFKKMAIPTLAMQIATELWVADALIANISAWSV